MPETDVDWGNLLARYEAMAVAFVRGLVGDAVAGFANKHPAAADIPIKLSRRVIRRSVF